MDERTRKELVDELLSAFHEVGETPFKKHDADDWRKERPQTFNCSSFAQWIALRCLGWGDSQRQDRQLDLPRAGALFTNRQFPEVEGDAAEPGDLCLYVDRDTEDAYHCMIFIGPVNVEESLQEVIGACENEGKMIRRPVQYDDRWELRTIRRIRLQ